MPAPHYHVHLRAPDGTERVLPAQFRSLASAMRSVSRVQGCVSIDGVKRDDYTISFEPCEDSPAACRYEFATESNPKGFPPPPHYHAHLRAPDGVEHVLPRRYRSLASAMRTIKKIDGQVVVDGERRTDLAVSMEPCGDSWSGCRHVSKARDNAETERQLKLTAD